MDVDGMDESPLIQLGRVTRKAIIFFSNSIFQGLSEYDRARARKIAEVRYGFRWHLPIYLIVNGGLVGLWYFIGPSFFPWPLFPIFFWGLGLISHYLIAYRRSLGGNWVDRETERILREEKDR